MANKADAVLVRFLVRELGVPRGRVRLVAGEFHRANQLLIGKMTPTDVARRLLG